MKTTDDALLAESPRWQAVGLLIDQNTRDLLARRYGLLQEVVSWFKVIELFREAEFERLIEQTPTPADRRYHKTWLATLIAEGERLLTEIRASRGLARNQAGIRLSDVEATVEELYDTQAEWYGGIAPQRRNELLRQVLPGSPS
jgi:hypothetical protein